MKKLLAFIMTLVIVISLAGCEILPEDMANQLQDIIDSVMGEHEHEYVKSDKESKEATCTEAGVTVYLCSCGDRKEETTEAIGHKYKLLSEKYGNCDYFGSIEYICENCLKKDVKTILPSEHEWSEFVESSRLIVCTKEHCNATKTAESSGKYDSIMIFNFDDEDKKELADMQLELYNILTAVKYDPDLHAYAEEGELAEAYAEAVALYEEYTNKVLHAQDQYRMAELAHYQNMADDSATALYDEMSKYYSELVAKYYELSRPWYDSMFREFFFYGESEEDILEFLEDSAGLSNPELKKLKDRNSEIEIEYNAIVNSLDAKIPVLYAELVANNKKIAELMGYDNYLEYAYESVYDRDYSYTEVANFTKYVKQYITPIYNRLMAEFNSISISDENVYEEYLTGVSHSFFENATTNKIFNDFIDDMNMGFTTNPNKTISFSDCLNDLMVDGNLFRGNYGAAFVTSLAGAGIPLAYFGEGNYQGMFTVAHEFGHYMNEIYNESKYSQSYDLLEVHSQGHEALLLYYVENQDLFSDAAMDIIKLQQIVNLVYAIVLPLTVDTFEQAVYLDSYDGYYAEEIMADGTITYDEYDLLYESIYMDYGISIDEDEDFSYWRMTVINSPCYYVSYAVSGIASIEIYMATYDKGFDSAKESFLKLFTYTDVDPSMDMESVLEYAGLLSYNDEQLYIKLNEFFMKNG